MYIRYSQTSINRPAPFQTMNVDVELDGLLKHIHILMYMTVPTKEWPDYLGCRIMVERLMDTGFNKTSAWRVRRLYRVSWEGVQLEVGATAYPRDYCRHDWYVESICHVQRPLWTSIRTFYGCTPSHDTLYSLLTRQAEVLLKPLDPTQLCLVELLC